MNRAQYLKFHGEFCEDMIETTKKKNADYAGPGDDPFHNFRQIQGLIQMPGVDVVSIGFLTRMSDKMSRIGTFVATGSLLVKEESVTDTLKDLSNYCALFAAYLEGERLRNAKKKK